MKPEKKRLCMRCKGEMIMTEVSEDMVGFSMVITKQFICADVECQKIGDKGIAQEKEKSKQREQLKVDSKNRAIANRAKAAALKDATATAK